MEPTYYTNPDEAPITTAFILHLRDEVAQKDVRNRALLDKISSGHWTDDEVRRAITLEIDQLWALFNHVFIAIHQLETGRPPSMTIPDEA